MGAKNLVPLVLGHVCLHACMAGLRMAAPLVALHQGYGPLAVGFLLALVSLTQVFLALPAGRFADRHGLKRPVGWAVLAAAEGTQISTISKAKQHGLFTYYWLKALLDGQQDLAAIYDYVAPKVQDEAKLQNVDQSPSLRPGAEQIRGKFALWDKQR